MKNKILLVVSLSFIIFVCFYNINITVEIVNKSINVFIKFLLPYIFPFMLLIHLFIKLKGGDLLTYFLQYPAYYLTRFKPYQTLSLFICLLSGYPTNSMYLETLYKDGKINKNDALNFIYLASFPTIYFVLGSLNKTLNNPLVCKLIFLSIFSSGFLILKRDKNPFIPLTKSKLSTTLNSYDFKDVLSMLKNTISTSILSLLNIFSTYIFYSILSGIIQYIFPYQITTFLCSFLEFSNGALSIAIMNINELLKFNLIIIILSIGSLSILTQIESNLKYLKLNYKVYFYLKIKHAFFACLIFNLFYIFFII